MAKKSTSKISKPSMSQERQWEIESAMSTIQRYNDILKNKELMSEVKKKAAELQKMVNGGTVKRK